MTTETPVKSSAASVTPSSQFITWLRSNPSPLHTYFSGRIDAIEPTQRDGKKFFRHEIVTPGIDEYSGPNRFEFLHASRLGAKGDSISGILNCRFWFAKPVQSKRADEDGVFGIWKPSKFSLELVEIFS